MEQEIIDTEYLKLETYKDIIREMKPRYNSFNKTDKSYIRSIAKDLGVKIGSCQNCFRDAYLEIRNILGIVETMVEIDTGVGYKFIGKTNTKWHGVFGSVALSEMTPLKVIERFVNDNPGQKVFVKIENNN